MMQTSHSRWFQRRRGSRWGVGVDLGKCPPPSLGPEKMGKIWETNGERGGRKGKVGEDGRKKTKQKNGTRKCLQVFKVFTKCYLVFYCSRILSDLI